MFLYRARSFHRSLRMQSMTLGLFTGVCYSHQTGLVKSQHVVLLPKHRGESEHQTDTTCISSTVSSLSAPLPGTLSLQRHPPPFPSPWPHTSHTVSESQRLSTPSVILLSALNDSAWCLAQRVCLSSIQLVSRGSLPACLSAPRVTTHESQESGNHVGPDVLPRFSQLVMPAHSSLVSAASAWPLFQRHYDMLAEALNNSQSSL